MGLTFLILACAVPTPKIFYPFFVLLFYALSALPVFIAKRTVPNIETNPKTEFALFLTAGMVLSAFALPIVLAHSSVVSILDFSRRSILLISRISGTDHLDSVHLDDNQ